MRILSATILVHQYCMSYPVALLKLVSLNNSSLPKTSKCYLSSNTQTCFQVIIWKMCNISVLIILFPLLLICFKLLISLIRLLFIWQKFVFLVIIVWFLYHLHVMITSLWLNRFLLLLLLYCFVLWVRTIPWLLDDVLLIIRTCICIH